MKEHENERPFQVKKPNSLSFLDLPGVDQDYLKTNWRAFLHKHLPMLINLAIFLAMVVTVAQGSPKLWHDIDWVDIVGEGSLALASLTWLYFIQGWRPPGPVTSILTLGFALLTYSFILDVLDEVLLLQQSWLGVQAESLAPPTAIAIITLGLINLNKEQRILQRQLRRREAHYRNHSEIDPVTDLYNGNYCRRALATALADKRPVTLCLINLENFSNINQRYGFATGDAVLNRVANTLVAAAPTPSLVCRYSSDRFVVIIEGHSRLPDLRQSLNLLLTEAVGLGLQLANGDRPNIKVQTDQLRSQGNETADELLQRATTTLQQRTRGSEAAVV